MSMVKAKKSLGQHFLKDQNIARKITESLLPVTGEVLEIGPGMGVLTRHLFANRQFSVRAIDIDQESIDYLHTELPDCRERILYGDFLKMNLPAYYTMPFSVIGNLPYNISSQIFFRIIEHRELIPQVVCMIQKEVAERISAPYGNKTYGILSVFLQAFYDIEYLFTVSEKVFDPPPKVKSAVVRLLRNRREKLDCEEKLFFNVVKTGFNQRRKTLRNSIRSICPAGFESDYLNLRPEQLSVDDFILLCKQISCAQQNTYSALSVNS
ncbi:MAG: 16S rRNA (adenine(1518)-N(6)/adenine(1519)-N(6))-dimethyltransferase RsmA [Odoribacter sp.]|nr:16S rRNA (adenine(1518)-N(6)/adenine(1519)-N(6))-dimethyltransferase RsmA [Odoribacter sp.]